MNGAVFERGGGARRPRGLRSIRAWRTAGVALCLALLGCAGGMPSIPNSSDAILAKGTDAFSRGKYFQSQELFKAFLERHAGHDRSDYAQFMLAESYFQQEEYALAAVEYRVLVTNYGYSEYVDDGFFKEALSHYRQAPKPQLDQTQAREALSQLEQFVLVYRSSPLIPEAERTIGEIREKLAEKTYMNAEYYFDRKLYISALIYIDRIIESYPGNPYWHRAKLLKAKTLDARGERLEEAVTLLREVIAEAEDPRIKREAQSLLDRMGGG